MSIIGGASAKRILVPAAILLACGGLPCLALNMPFTESFASYPLNVCLADGASLGPWTSAFGGYGCSQVETDGANDWLEETPFASVSPSETHSSLVLGPAFSAPITFSARVYTAAQLRKNTPPNPWEVAWVFWNYRDNSHFYYFQAKPNGWELGKEDPAYAGSQRFLATGTAPLFPIGAWYAVKVVQIQETITVYVNGQLITTFTDTQNPYTAGSIGLYNEDSDVRFADVVVDATPPSSASGPAGGQAKAPQKILSPALPDGINDVATFGASAAEVSIYNLRGRRVFHASQQGGASIVWDCKDGMGRVDDPGVYIAKIRTSGSGVLYQSFALVK